MHLLVFAIIAFANAAHFVEYRWESSTDCTGTPARVWSVWADCLPTEAPTACECTNPIDSGVYNCSIFACMELNPTYDDGNILPSTAGDYQAAGAGDTITFPLFAWYSRWDGTDFCEDGDGEKLEASYSNIYPTKACTHYRDALNVVLSQKLRCVSSSSYYNNYYYKRAYRYSYSSYYYSPAKLYFQRYRGTGCKGKPVSNYVYLDCELNTNLSSEAYSYRYWCKTCFHRDTEISYEGQKYTLEQFKGSEHSDKCVIPHVVKTDGVIIKTACPNSKPLRLTTDHLVYTQNGLVQAETVKIGDSLFADLETQVPCEVVSVGVEKNQEYFGLNCHNSVVLADGYKTSTFGIYHNVPAAWMKIAGKVLGIKRASEWGDVMARFFYSLVPH